MLGGDVGGLLLQVLIFEASLSRLRIFGDVASASYPDPNYVLFKGINPGLGGECLGKSGLIHFLTFQHFESWEMTKE